MERTWKPTTAGILSIVAGFFGVIGGILLAVLGAVGGGILGTLGLPGLGGMAAAAAAVPLIFGIIAIVGGVYALKRKIWGLALAGSICALICVWFLGIPAIIFAAMGKKEFA